MDELASHRDRLEAMVAERTRQLQASNASLAEQQNLLRTVADHLQQQPDTTHVMLVAHPINWIDATGAEAFGRLRERLDDQRVHLHLVGVKLPVERVLRTAGHLYENERLHLYRTEAEALQAIAQGATAEPEAAPGN